MPDPALIFEGLAPEQPGTHVLLVGVSSYDHLLGGRDEKPAIADGMGQLGSPSRSARLLADWFLDEFRNDEVPLQSLALVTSEQDSQPFRPGWGHGQDIVPPMATFANVRAAAHQWLFRASRSVENMTVLFFAGHGVTNNDPLLFMQDFGADQFDKYAAVLNLNDFVDGMQTMVPGRQLFLIDACRTPGRTTIELAGRHRGSNIVSVSEIIGTGRSLARQSVHHASTEFSAAYGDPEGASLFTQAVIRALRGGGAQPNMRWHVGTGGLEQALGAYVSRAAREHFVVQAPERSRAHSFPISKPDSIHVPLHVSLDILEAWPHLDRMEATCGAGVSATWTHDVSEPGEEWSCVVPLREHTVAAAFKEGAAFSHGSEIVMVAPPETVHTLTIRPGTAA